MNFKINKKVKYMRFVDLLKLSTRMFKARPTRTILTVLGMAVGIGAILFLVSLGYGIQRAMLNNITTSDSLSSLSAIPPERLVVNRETIAEIGKTAGVEKVSPVFETSGKIKIENLTAEAGVSLVDEKFLSYEGKNILAGEGFSNNSGEEAIVSAAFLKIFDLSEDQILNRKTLISIDGLGEKGDIAAKEYVVEALVESEQPMVYLNLKDFSPDQVPSFSWIKVKCNSSNEIPGVKEKLASQGFSISALSDVVDEADKVFRVARIILGFFGIIALVVSAIGMFNTMTVSLLERTEEIGIMKSIGASNRNILSMFIFESTLMGFLGGICGVVLGVLGGKFINFVFNIVAGQFGGRSAEIFYYPGWFLVFTTFLAAVVGFLTGIIPARRASKIDPLEALRYK